MNFSRQDILFFQNRVAYARDERTYEKIFFHFHPMLFRFAAGIIKNREIADEIVSDVMMRIWDLGSKLAQVENLKVYLFTATKNACLNELGKKKWNNTLLGTQFENEMIDTGNNPENLLLCTEIQRNIEHAVTGLPPQCQLIFRLIREQGFSYRETSAIAGISQNTIETHMRLALRKIRLALNGYLQEKNN